MIDAYSSLGFYRQMKVVFCLKGLVHFALAALAVVLTVLRPRLKNRHEIVQLPFYDATLVVRSGMKYSVYFAIFLYRFRGSDCG